jgi:hypothetical protein
MRPHAILTKYMREQRFRLRPDIAIEDFGETAVLFLEEDERFVTVNRAAADLVPLIREAFGDQYLDTARLAALFERSFELGGETAWEASAGVVRDWLVCGLFEEDV